MQRGLLKNYLLVHFWCLQGIILYQISRYETAALEEQEFIPTVTATCKADYMTIKVSTNQPFVGVVHTKDFRTPACINYGNGSNVVTLGINLSAAQGSSDYCGVFVNNRNEEKSVSVPVAVRMHRTLELADDKIYVITCGKSGFKNSKNELSLVSLNILEDDKKVQDAFFGHQYILRAEVSKPDGTHGIRVKSCFAFGKVNRSEPLVNNKGCPINKQVISEFKYDESSSRAEAILYSMFKLPDSRELHFQCNIAICNGICPAVVCDKNYESDSLAQYDAKEVLTENANDEGTVPASTSVFVLEPGDSIRSGYLCEEQGGIRPLWLLYLCIAFGLMFLIMLILTIFLCSAMTCSCARTEVIEKEPSIIEDYDPYRSWHGSQYGSRYSLNGKPGYTSGGSTMNSTRSISTNSDHYAIVHSRPGSRYSPSNGINKHNHHFRPPPSHLSSHYNGKLS